MKQLPTLDTERLLLRPFALSDAADVQRLAGDWKIADTTTLPHPYEDGMAQEWIDTHAALFDEGFSCVVAITSREYGELLGSMSLLNVEIAHQAEIGYWVGVPYWGNGYCTEAAQAILEFGFLELGLQRVYGKCMTRNPGSGRVMEKLGFQREGCLRSHILKWGILEDADVFGILKSEWEAK